MVAAPPRFVVGTGRCGSTLLSLMLAEHRQVASIHECFNGLDGRRFSSHATTAAELVALLGSEQPVTTKVLALGHTSDEIQYPFDAAGARHRRGAALPWLLVGMLSRLSHDPDALHEELLAFAAGLPTQPMAAHWEALFGWLASTRGRTEWVERSGSSIDYVGDLVRLWPDARFVHIHRDGHEAALSIRNHPFFRLALAVVFDLFPTDAGLTEDDVVRQVVETAPPAWCAGRFWSDQVLHGYRALPGLDRDQWLDVRFERLVAEPAAELARIADFFGLPADDGFPARGAALVGDPPPLRFPTLPDDEQDALREACRPGMVLLGRAG